MNIVITGASKGMGKAMAERFARDNNNIFICARTFHELESTAQQISNSYPGVTIHYTAADLSTRAGVDQFASWYQGFGATTDILINNAGSFLPGSVYNEEEGTLENMIQTNLYSAYYLTRALLPAMIKQKSGHVFNMCSIASLQAYANGGSYSISKFALAGFSKNLREEMKTFGIKVTTVYPGAVYTDSWKASGYPEERFIKEKDIADLIYTTAQLSPQACVEELIIRPILGDI